MHYKFVFKIGVNFLLIVTTIPSFNLDLIFKVVMREPFAT